MRDAADGRLVNGHACSKQFARRKAAQGARQRLPYIIARFGDANRNHGKARPAVLGRRMADNILTIETLLPRLSRYGRLMGIDLGTKTIGLALSDVERRIATPLETIQRTKFTKDVARMVELATKHEVVAYVIGLPLNMDGSEGPRAQSTHAFIRNCAPLTPIPFIFQDERLSTAAVTRSLIEQDASRAKRAEVVDRMAAAYILQGVLDRLTYMTRDLA
jgi:putative Holliday junction resolvase